MHSPLEARLGQQLAQWDAANLYRRRRVVSGAHGVQMTVDGQPCLNFCSNDYLGLASHPALSRAAQAVPGHGAGAAALVSGYNREHQALEEALAEWLGQPRALLFSSGWAANLGTLKALLGKDDVLLADELNHASLIDGGRLSGAQYQRIAHAKPSAYASALQALAPSASRQVLLATDSIFSMDGDRAPLPALSALAQQHGAALMVDDAHGFGVLGQGRGVLHETSAPLHADVYMAGFGKALGSAGAFVAGSVNLVEYLVQRARSWVFSTAPPPASAAASRAALAIIASEEGTALRAQLAANIQQFRQGAAQLGLPLSASDTAIQPLILGSEARALAASHALFQQGYWVAAIRPPTVPPGTSRLRITLTARHTPLQINGLLSVLAQVLYPVA